MPKKKKTRKAGRRPVRRTARRDLWGGCPESVVFCDDRGPRLRLSCDGCGATGRYSVGTVLLDPAAGKALARDPGGGLESAFGFTGYFRCRTCGAGGPWSFPGETALFLAAAPVSWGLDDPESFRIARMALFDGTAVQYASQSEEHLKTLIERSPGDAYLHDRLGNVYVLGGRPDLALPVFHEALALDPDLAFSRYSRGELYIDEGRFDEAAADFHHVLRTAHRVTSGRRKELRGVARFSLERLLQLNERSEGKIPVLPPEVWPPAGVESRTSDGVRIAGFDLGTERGRQRLANTFLPPSGLARLFSRRPRRSVAA